MRLSILGTKWLMCIQVARNCVKSTKEWWKWSQSSSCWYSKPTTNWFGIFDRSEPLGICSQLLTSYIKYASDKVVMWHLVEASLLFLLNRRECTHTVSWAEGLGHAVAHGAFCALTWALTHWSSSTWAGWKSTCIIQSSVMWKVPWYLPWSQGYTKDTYSYAD